MTRTFLARSAFALALLAFVLIVADTAAAQTTATLRVIRRAPIVDAPRGDGFVLGMVDPGTQLQVIAQQGRWLEVETPSGFSRPRGWISLSAVKLLTPIPGQAPPPRGATLFRVFGAVAPTFFTADDSTKLVLGSATGLFLGGGAQYVWPNGAFVLGNYERMNDSGSRVIVSGSQVFSLTTSDTVTITPINVAVGYRDYQTKVVAPYVGFGVGFHRFREASEGDAVTITRSHVSANIFGGVERRLLPWVSAAGEAQWTWATHLIGDTGVSAAAHENDLGGVTLRVKVIVGR